MKIYNTVVYILIADKFQLKKFTRIKILIKKMFKLCKKTFFWV